MQRLGDEEDRRARLWVLDIYRAAKDIPKALETAKKALEKYPNDPALVSSRAMLLGEEGQTDEAVKILRSQLTGSESDRDTFLSIAIGFRARELRAENLHGLVGLAFFTEKHRPA